MKRQREPEELDLTRYLQMVLNKGIPEDLLGYMFALLRDRPYTLVNIYRVLGLASIDPNLDDDAHIKLKHFLQVTFHNLWFLSFKDVFTDEMICVFEYDYFIKYQMNYSYNSDYITYILESLETILSIDKLFTNSDRNHAFLGQRGVLFFLIERAKNIKVQSDNTIDYNQIKSDNRVIDYFAIEGYSDDDDYDNSLFLKDDPDDYLGFHIKMRRILFIVVSELLTKINYLILSINATLFFINNKNITDPILENLVVAIIVGYQEFERSITGLVDYKFTKEDDPIMKPEKKAEYFNFFTGFKDNLYNILQFVPENDDYRSKVSKLFDTFYSEIIDSSFLYNIIIRVENEIQFPDNILFNKYFYDNEYADNLMIDTKNRFKWLYSYYEPNQNKISYLTDKEIDYANNTLAIYWFTLLNYRMSQYDEEDIIQRFSKKIF